MYCALVALTIPHHEPWADEAQAWQIARSNSFIELFRTAIHYEVSPGLWHGLLWLLIRLHVSYAGLPWVSAAIALCGVCLILFASPLPLALRLILPFTYFFAFQYSVVARNYVLFAPILFLLATIWRRREQHPILLSLLIGLLANVSAHGLATALGLIFVLLVEEWKHVREKHDERNPKQTTAPRNWIIAIVLLTALVAFAIWCMIPPRDANWVVGASLALHRPAAAASRQLLYSRDPLQWVPMALRIPTEASLWLTYVLGYGVSQPTIVACIAWALLLWRWWREKRLRCIAPVLSLAGLCILSRFYTYHAGLIWVLLLFLWWVTWPENNQDPRQMALIILFAFFMISQLVWTERVVRYDMTQAYSPDRAAVPILRRYLAEGKQVDIAAPPPSLLDNGEYYAVGLEPYFASEPFHNAPARYWIWRPHPAMYSQYVRDTQDRSVVVMLESSNGKIMGQGEQERLVALGYRQDANVCGRVVYPRKRNAELCHVFYVPN
jgi:hypothetical protein